MTKHIGRALAVLTGTMLAGAMLATPASAQTEHSAASAWSAANADAFIVDATTVELRGANTSVETTNLDFPVQAHHKIKFTYELLDGAVCGAGAPRVFVEIDGDYINSWDGNAGQCGIDNGDGTFTVEFSTGKNGRIGAMGVMFDQSGGYIAGSAVRVSNVFVDSTLMLFEPRSVETPSPSPTPSTPADDDDDDVDDVDDGKDDDAGAGGGDADDNDTLPVTGAPAALIAGAGAALLGAGLVLWWAMKRRTPKFDV